MCVLFACFQQLVDKYLCVFLWLCWPSFYAVKRLLLCVSMMRDNFLMPLFSRGTNYFLLSSVLVLFFHFVPPTCVVSLAQIHPRRTLAQFKHCLKMYAHVRYVRSTTMCNLSYAHTRTYLDFKKEQASAFVYAWRTGKCKMINTDICIHIHNYHMNRVYALYLFGNAKRGAAAV